MTATPGFDRPAPSPMPAPPNGSVNGAPAPGKKVTVNWVGALMALGAIIAAVGTFLPWEKFVFRTDGRTIGTLSLTGIGGKSTTGREVVTVTTGNGGKIIIGVAVLILVAAALILAKKGKLWVGIVSLVVSALGLLFAFVGLGLAKADAKTLRGSGLNAGDSLNGLTKMGVTVCIIGMGIIVVGSILAIVMRRRTAA